ncbi:MAG TPA: UDP-N-acetylglucosamine 1-carboxyvinyltransferase, partial [Caldilinea sp.]|nr:UDP-N-acetylglucosamine 1-carboxyvinyltransferase [Caldilinea sp.]
MTSFIIEGGRPLRGAIRPIGNKNAALPMLAACLLTDEPIILHNLPRIGDVHTMMSILGEMGVDIQEQANVVTLLL